MLILFTPVSSRLLLSVISAPQLFLHAGYFLIFLLFMTSSQLRLKWWPLLVRRFVSHFSCSEFYLSEQLIYCSASILALFFWSFLAPVFAKTEAGEGARHEGWAGIVGFVTGTGESLWQTTFITHIVILVSPTPSLTSLVDVLLLGPAVRSSRYFNILSTSVKSTVTMGAVSVNSIGSTHGH